MTQPPDDSYWMKELPVKHWTENLGPDAFFEYLQTETPEQRKERTEWHLRKPHVKFLKEHLKGPKPNGPNGQDTSRRSREFTGFITLAEFLEPDAAP